MAAILCVKHGFSLSKVKKVVSLTPNQLKHGFRKFRNMLEQENVKDCRLRAHVPKLDNLYSLKLQITAVINQSVFIEPRKIAETLKSKFEIEAPSVPKVKKILRYELEFKYMRVSRESERKNYDDNKQYRKLIANISFLRSLKMILSSRLTRPVLSRPQIRLMLG